jgi:hypothetical protein
MRPDSSRLRGQAATDCLLLAALVALAVGLGADGAIGRLIAGLGERFARFAWSISLP